METLSESTSHLRALQYLLCCRLWGVQPILIRQVGTGCSSGNNAVCFCLAPLLLIQCRLVVAAQSDYCHILSLLSPQCQLSQDMTQHFLRRCLGLDITPQYLLKYQLKYVCSVENQKQISLVTLTCSVRFLVLFFYYSLIRYFGSKSGNCSFQTVFH